MLCGKVISRRSKELKSDPGSCPLVLGAILKIWVTSSYIQFWLWPGLVTKIQTTKLSILPRFYFHDVLGQLKSNFHANFRFKRVLGFVTEHAWISKLLHDGAFTWRPRELSRRLKIYLISGNFAILTVYVFFTVFPANPDGIVGSFIHEFVFCEWAKAVIFNHFSFKTSAIISISWGKVNFVIQTKNLKGESSKSARKTAKVKQNRWLVMSLH